jgi:hypothetical protein
VVLQTLPYLVKKLSVSVTFSYTLVTQKL